MQYKIIFTTLSTIIAIVAFIPYLKDIFQFKTKPHAYTWLIWVLTQGTAVLGAWYGGGGLGIMNLTIGLFFVFAVFLFSLKYGTKNITKGDTITLVAALCAIFVWWQLHQPLLSIIMVSVIDFVGYFPTFRKTFEEPWSETLFSWGAFTISNFLAMLALAKYNFLTLTYIIVISIANIIIFFICLLRRPIVSKPEIIEEIK